MFLSGLMIGNLNSPAMDSSITWMIESLNSPTMNSSITWMIDSLNSPTMDSSILKALNTPQIEFELHPKWVKKKKRLDTCSKIGFWRQSP